MSGKRWDDMFVGNEDRAVSTVLGYILALSISAILISGVLLGATTYIDSQQDRVAREQAEAVGSKIVDRIASTDRLATVSNHDGEVLTRVTLPRQIARSTYAIHVVNKTAPAGAGDQPFRYRIAVRVEETVTNTTVRTHHPMKTNTVGGGKLVVAYNNSDGTPAEKLQLRQFEAWVAD